MELLQYKSATQGTVMYVIQLAKYHLSTTGETLTLYYQHVLYCMVRFAL